MSNDMPKRPDTVPPARILYEDSKRNVSQRSKAQSQMHGQQRPAEIKRTPLKIPVHPVWRKK